MTTTTNYSLAYGSSIHLQFNIRLTPVSIPFEPQPTETKLHAQLERGFNNSKQQRSIITAVIDPHHFAPLCSLRELTTIKNASKTTKRGYECTCTVAKRGYWRDTHLGIIVESIRFLRLLFLLNKVIVCNEGS